MITADQVHGWSDDQLRVAIAEALGWRVEISYNGDWPYYYDTILLDPGGKEIQAAAQKRDLAHFATPGGYLPNWHADLNAAAELIGDKMHMTGYPCSNCFGNPVQVYWIRLWIDNVREVKAYATTRARAWSEAWYLWHLSKGNQS